MKKLQFLGVLSAVLLSLTFIGCAQEEDSSDWWDDLIKSGPNVLSGKTVYDAATAASATEKIVFKGDSYEYFAGKNDANPTITGNYAVNAAKDSITFIEKKASATSLITQFSYVYSALISAGLPTTVLTGIQAKFAGKTSADLLDVDVGKPIFEWIRDNETTAGLAVANVLLSTGKTTTAELVTESSYSSWKDYWNGYIKAPQINTTSISYHTDGTPIISY